MEEGRGGGMQRMGGVSFLFMMAASGFSFFFFSSFFVTRVLLSCNRAQFWAVWLCCSVAEMLDLDFRSGVVITYRVGSATQDCLGWKNRFLFERLCAATAAARHEDHIWNNLWELCCFFCCDVHGVQFKHTYLVHFVSLPVHFSLWI